MLDYQRVVESQHFSTFDQGPSYHPIIMIRDLYFQGSSAQRQQSLELRHRTGFSGLFFVGQLTQLFWTTFFQLLGITYLIGNIKFKLLFHGALAE